MTAVRESRRADEMQNWEMRWMWRWVHRAEEPQRPWTDERERDRDRERIWSCKCETLLTPAGGQMKRPPHNSSTHTHACTYTNKHTHSLSLARAHTRTHMHTHSHTHKHTLSLTHTHTIYSCKSSACLHHVTPTGRGLQDDTGEDQMWGQNTQITNTLWSSADLSCLP